MNSKFNRSVMERRNANTAEIDRLSTLDMLTVINQEDKQIFDAIHSCLPDIARLVDNATATLRHGGRLVIIGAGVSGRAAVLAACEYAPMSGSPPVIGLIAGGHQAMFSEANDAANDDVRGVLDLEAIGFCERDMLISLSVSGNTPWVWGAMRYAKSTGAIVAAITSNTQSEAAQRADILVSPQSGAEVIAGFGCPKAGIAQRLILNMVTTGLAVRTGKVFGNLRVDLEASSIKWIERQIAIVMVAGSCSRAIAKAALTSSGHNCKAAIVMVLTGADAAQAKKMLLQNEGYLRMVLKETPAA